MSDDARRAQLLAAQLGALARTRAGELELEPRAFPGGAAAVARPGGGVPDVAWILLDTDPVTALGAALVWADREGAADVHLVAGAEAAPVLARRAGCFAPAPTVWTIAGAALEPAVAAPVAVAPPTPPAPELAELLVDADLEVLVEHGIVRGEVQGLEVARIVHGTSTAGEPLDGPLLEVGVGQADRELTGMVHSGMPSADQLARVRDIVATHRRADAPPHPLNQLVPERWLRARLAADPARIGLAELHPASPAVPRANLREKGVAMATGTRPDGSPVVVACSVGIDLGLVPAAADARLALAPQADLLVVVPERDAHPVTAALCQRLARPAQLVALPGEWRE